MIGNDWDNKLSVIWNSEGFKRFMSIINHEYDTKTIYPPKDDIFAALKNTPFKDVKVVIVGQDPYHEPGQAMGLSFSVPSGIQVPPSLINIYKEIQNEYNVSLNLKSGDLTYLAIQGVLLLNSILSVRAHEPMSHNIKEYEEFFNDVLAVLSEQQQPIVYMLWGSSAKKFKKYLHNPNHLILESVHPSPLAANRGGWFGNNHFKKANEYLSKNGVKEIKWANI